MEDGVSSMQGTAKKLIDELVLLRTRGNVKLAPFVRAQLVMRGINPERYTDETPDDPRVIQELQDLLTAFRR